VIEYGTLALVAAQIVRVIRDPLPDRVVYKQAQPRRDAGRYQSHDFKDATGWPGEPVPLAWNSAVPQFDPEPDEPIGALVRLRRLPFRRPQTGIVIGATFRQEGRILGGRTDADDPAHLAGPGRRIELAEVALQPGGRGKATLVLAHPRDCYVPEGLQ
jgi:hypothetical protein